MFSILEICTFISYIYFKTIVIDNLHLFKKWRGSSLNKMIDRKLLNQLWIKVHLKQCPNINVHELVVQCLEENMHVFH